MGLQHAHPLLASVLKKSKTDEVDRNRALQTLIVANEAETGVIATDDLPHESGDDVDPVEVGVACSDGAISKASRPLITVIQFTILFPQLHW